MATQNPPPAPSGADPTTGPTADPTGEEPAGPTEVAATVEALRRAGCVFAEEEAALLLADRPTAELRDARLARRVAGEPLEYVLGWAAFAGLRILVRPGVFVPRHRSEFLVELAVAAVAGVADPIVVDLCCGTGALGLAVAARSPAIRLHATDLDPAAVACAERNLAGAGTTYQGDLFAALPTKLRGHVDLIVVNAPYVPTGEIALMPPEARDHEHRLALDGGDDGLDLHRRIAADALSWLRPGGRLLIEAGARQATTSAAHFRDGGLAVLVHHDDERDATVVVGVRPILPAADSAAGPQG